MLSPPFYPNGSCALPGATRRTGVEEMGRSKLQKCPKCARYALASECPECGIRMTVAAPLKFSPEDRQGERRRERKGVESGEWAQSLPSIEDKGSEEE